MLSELGAAVTLLTRAPGWGGAVAPARAVWAFPLVGAAVGGLGALVLWAGRLAGVPGALAALWAVAAMAVASGALHEDGLADLADGFGGGQDAAGKLAIMRDSRIGSYGALALVLLTGVRVAALASLSGGALVAGAALGRGAIGVPLLMLRPARAGGLGALVDKAGWRRWACVALGAALAALASPAAAAAGLAAAAALSLLARAQVGGYTGDVLGGCACVAEAVALTVLAAG